MAQNSGFLAVGTLAVVLIFFGLRSFDDQGRFNPLREPAPPRLEMARDGSVKEIAISAERDGHFVLDATIGGRATELLVDTGASIVTLRESDARKAGLRPSGDDYRIAFSTANGQVMGARGVLPELTISGVTLRELPVVILPDDRLEVSLFGVNGLNRFARMESTADELILYTQ